MEVQLVSSFRDDVIHSLVCKKKKKKTKIFPEPGVMSFRFTLLFQTSSSKTLLAVISDNERSKSHFEECKSVNTFANIKKKRSQK